MKLHTGTIFVLLAGAVLSGCSTGTGYMVAHQEEQAVRQSSGAILELPELPRSRCVRKKLADRGADPSRLTVVISSMPNTTVHPQIVVPGGQTPQFMFLFSVQDAVVSLGIRVPHDAADAEKNPTKGQYLLDGGMTAFAPLTRALTGRDDVDLLIPQWAREKRVASGSLTATAILYAPVNGKYVSWTSATSTAIFFQIKDSQRVNFGFKTGVSAGTAIETIEVNTVQDVSSMVMKDVAVKVLSKALGLNC